MHPRLRRPRALRPRIESLEEINPVASLLPGLAMVATLPALEVDTDRTGPDESAPAPARPSLAGPPVIATPAPEAVSIPRRDDPAAQTARTPRPSRIRPLASDVWSSEHGSAPPAGIITPLLPVARSIVAGDGAALRAAAPAVRVPRAAAPGVPAPRSPAAAPAPDVAQASSAIAAGGPSIRAMTLAPPGVAVNSGGKAATDPGSGSMNQQPVAVDDAAETTSGSSVTIDVLNNDSDSDGDSLSVTGTTAAGHGTVSGIGGSVSYTPEAGFRGSDSFGYTIDDGRGGTASATVTVNVTGSGSDSGSDPGSGSDDDSTNHPPVAVDDTATADAGASVSVGVLGNDSDPDNDPLSVSSYSQAGHGTVSGSGGSLTYTPEAGFYGSDSFGYTIDDGRGGSASATVTVDVAGSNQPPVALPDDGATHDQPVTVGVLGNDSDPDNDPLTITGVTQPAHGSVVSDASTVTYTPAADFFNGTDSFSYTISDGRGGTASANVTVAVMNQPPMAHDDVALHRDPIAIDVLANDSDSDGDSIEVIGVGVASYGTASWTSSGVTYTPGEDFAGQDSFTYTIGDQHDGTSTATVFIEDQPPTGENDSATTPFQTAVTIAALANDSDPDGDPIRVTGAAQGAHGSVTWTSGGSLTYTPEDGFSGADSFTYTLRDILNVAALATVSLQVLPPNVTVNGAQYHGNTPNQVDFTYSTSGGLRSFRASLYYSADGTFDGTDALLTTQVVAPGASNPQSGSFRAFGGPFSSDPGRPYLLVVADPANTISESDETDNTSGALLLSTVTVAPDHSVYTLLETSSFQVHVNLAVPGASYLIQGRRFGNFPYIDLGTSSRVTWVERVAGQFLLRAFVTIAGVRFGSSAVDFEVGFPSYADITSDAAVISEATRAWNDSEAEARANSGAPDATGAYPGSLRREQGYWIYLDTISGRYGRMATIYGNWYGPAGHPLLDLGNRPADNYGASPGPPNIDGVATYIVASFHTHTPNAFRDRDRWVGPSDRDNTSNAVYDVPGLVYDYVATLRGTHVPAYHPMGSPAMLYPSGPDWRSTP